MLPSDPTKKRTPARPEADLEPAHDAREAAPAETPAALSSAPSLGALMHSLRRSWKVVMPAALLAAGLAAGAVWMVVPAQYTSTLMLRLLQRSTLGSLDDGQQFPDVQKAQVAILKSFEVTSEVIVKSRVQETYGITETPQGLARKLITDFNDGPEMLAVRLSGENPEAVAAILNAVGDVLPAKMLKADEVRVDATIQAREKEFQALSKVLEGKRNELAAEERRHNVEREDGFLRARDRAEQRLADIGKEVRAAAKELSDKKVEETVLEQSIASPRTPVIPERDVEADAATIKEYVEAFQAADAIRQKIAAHQRSSTKAVKDVEIPALERKLRGPQQIMDAVKEQIRKDLAEKARTLKQEEERSRLTALKIEIEERKKNRDALVKQEDKARNDYEGFKTGGTQVPSSVLRLRDEVINGEKELAKVGEMKAGLSALKPITPRLQRHTEAFVPTEKDYSRPTKYALAAGVLTFGLFLVGGCLMEARSRKISDSSEIREGLGLRIIGTIPRLPSSARRKSAAALSMGGLDSQYGLTEAVDAVRTRLLHAPRVDGARIIMITSATTGEGKTTLASHLAASLARAWRKTLLIDGDLRNPNAHLQFDLPAEPGLSEALRGEMEYEDAITPTSLSRLWVLPAGKIDAHALQALTQDGLSAVFDRLKEQFDFIVIDTSPVIPVPDALVLGQQADAVVLSVMRDVSRMPAVYAAQQSLEDLGIRVLGAVVSGEKTETYGKAVPYGPIPGGS